jgi:phosphatidate cytidylyltransferase
MLLPRVLTAIVGIPFFLYLIQLGGLPFAALVVGLAMLALHEYATVLWLGGRGVQRAIVVIGGGAVAAAVAFGGSFPSVDALVPMTITGVVFAAILRELLRKEHSLDRAALTVFGALFVGWTLGHLALLRDLRPDGRAWTFLLFAAVWTCDSLAYFTGMSIGKRRLAPVISPKKSWEGLIGGVVGAFAAVFIARKAFMAPVMPVSLGVALALLIGIGGQVSDLSQSLVKRAAGVKDSASLLPGHGGIFDRMDAFLLLAPAVYYLLLFTASA